MLLGTLRQCLYHYNERVLLVTDARIAKLCETVVCYAL